MGSNSSIPGRFWYLVDAVCADSASIDEKAALESLLHKDRSACVRYIEYCQMHTDLHLVLRSDQWTRRVLATIHDGEQSKTTRPPLLRFLGRITDRVRSSQSLLFAIVLIGLCGWFLLHAVSLIVSVHNAEIVRNEQAAHKDRVASGAGDGQENLNQPVAQLTAAVGCRWEGDPALPVDFNAGAAPAGLKFLPGGKHLELREGLAEVTFNTGAKVTLRAPTKFVVENKESGNLQSGSLLAEVPRAAIGFSILTDTARIVDLGTKFGVTIEDSKSTEVEVFTGKIELHPVAEDGLVSPPIVLVAGEARSIRRTASGGTEITKRAVRDDQTIARKWGEAEKKQPKTASSYERWREHSRKLESDPQLIAYYPFERDPRSPDRLTNHAAATAGRFDGMIDGATWTQGRWPEKQSLQFPGANDRVRLDLPADCDSLSLSAWLLEAKNDRPINGLFMTDGWGHRGQVAWQFLRQKGEMLLEVAGGVQLHASIPRAQNDVHPWRHLALVYDSHARRATMFIDGSVVTRESIAEPMRLQLGSCQIGNWKASILNDVRNWAGQIDELAIFGRPLSSDEVWEIYREGRP